MKVTVKELIRSVSRSVTFLFPGLSSQPKTTTVNDSNHTMSFTTQGVTPELKAQYLLTLPAIRDRCSQVHDLAKEGKLEYFEYHPGNEEKVADFCLEIIQVAVCRCPKSDFTDRVLPDR